MIKLLVGYYTNDDITAFGLNRLLVIRITIYTFNNTILTFNNNHNRDNNKNIIGTIIFIMIRFVFIGRVVFL